MKTQIARLSPHQNAKVFAVIMALMSLFIVVPMMIVIALVTPAVDQFGRPVSPPTFMIMLFPVIYLVLGYVMTIVWCAIYNLLFRFLGGIEFESAAKET